MADTARTLDGVITAEDYLAREEVSPVRHEFANGVLYAMVGGTERHHLIAGNLFFALRSRLPAGCRPFMADVKLRILSNRSEYFYYPDCMVCCGPSDQSQVWRDNPLVLGEVLSPSTERIDRQEKFSAYTQVPTLREFLLIEQSMQRVELFQRDNGWQREVLGVGDRLRLASIDFEIGLDALYQDVEF